jgi:competence ComEA-like helix-hairpin-helix protein
MLRNIFIAISFCAVVLVLVSPARVLSQGWPDSTVRSLPDSSFALVEFDENGRKVRHFPYRDMNSRIHNGQLIHCLGTFSHETWVEAKNKETARRDLEEHYYRFKLKQLKKGMTGPVNINKVGLEDLVCLPNIGPVTAVKICRFRQAHGSFQTIEDIKRVEGIGPSIFAGIRYYIRVQDYPGP